MGKLSDIVNKGVRLIVTDSSSQENTSPPPPPAEREIPPDELQVEPPRRVEHSEVPADVADFAAVYSEAGIELPSHNYGVDKVAEMLDNKRLASLGKDARATAVMVALEAAGVSVRDVIQDAVQRDKALDDFEAAKQREVAEIRARNQERIQQLNAEVEAIVKKVGAEVEALKKEAEQAEKAFAELQGRKRKEEQRLRDIVGQFIEGGGENPITV
jgi:uncharacterized protein HemX